MSGWRIALWILLVAGILAFLYLVRGVLLPFIVSLILSALLEPITRKLRLKGWSKGAAMWAVIGPFYVFLILLGILVTPSLAREVGNLSGRAEDLVTSLSESSDKDNFFLNWNPVTENQQSATTTSFDNLLREWSGTLEKLGLPSNRRAIMEQYVEPRRPEIANAVKSGFNSMFGVLTNVFSQLVSMLMIFILVPLCLADMDNFRKKAPRWVPPAIRASTMSILGDIGQVFVKYLRGIATVWVMYSTLMGIVYWIAGVPYWILLAPLSGALYLIPYVGALAQAVVVFMTVGFSGETGWLLHPTSNSWAYGGIVAVTYLIISTVFDQLVYPRMVGSSVGLSPVVSMFVIFCGGALFGLPGMLVAFPFAGSVKVILDRLLRVTSKDPEQLRLPVVPLRHRT